MEPHCLGKVGDPGRRGANNRLFMEAVLWIARTGSPWRDLPERFGNWSTAIRRFRDWRAVMSSSVSSTRCQMSLTWSTPWSTRRSSRSTATDRAQKGDSEPEPPQDGQADPDAGADRTRLRRRARLALFQTTGLPAADPSFFNTIGRFRPSQKGPFRDAARASFDSRNRIDSESADAFSPAIPNRKGYRPRYPPKRQVARDLEQPSAFGFARQR